MRKAKYFLIGMVVTTLVFSTSAMALFYVDGMIAEHFMNNTTFSSPVLEVTTDKMYYDISEDVCIFLTNIGDETLCGGGPIVTIYDENEDIVYQEATYCWYELEPGEYIEWPPWDQTDQYGNQVPDGEYTVGGYLSDGNGGGWVDDAIFYIGNYKGDELDQYQTEWNWFGPIGVFPLIPDVNTIIAQSFIPTKNVLTRVELLIGKNVTTTYPCFLAIREDLNGEDLAVTSVDAEDVVTDDFDWAEFDFDDVPVTAGLTYYMVSYTANVTDNFYGWAANLFGGYPNGTVFISQDDEQTWEENETVDMAFMTYGIDNSPPYEPQITGETNGKVGRTYTYCIDTVVDPDGDGIYVYFDWDDGTNTGWLGPYASGEQVCADHSWSKKGMYTIKAKLKDDYGAESEWATLEVSMPRTYTPLILRLLERFPHAFPVLRYILKL